MTEPDSSKSNLIHCLNETMCSEFRETFSARELQKAVKTERILSVFLLAVLTADVF